MRTIALAFMLTAVWLQVSVGQSHIGNGTDRVFALLLMVCGWAFLVLSLFAPAELQ